MLGKTTYRGPLLARVNHHQPWRSPAVEKKASLAGKYYSSRMNKTRGNRGGE